MLKTFSHNILWLHYFPFQNSSYIFPISLPTQIYELSLSLTLKTTTPILKTTPQRKKIKQESIQKSIRKKITCCQNLVLVKCDIWGPWQWVVLKIFGNHKRMVIGQKKGSKMAQGKVESLPRGWIHLQPDKFFSSNFLLLFSIFLSSQKTNSWFD